jgi:hypothetical protein
MDAAVGTETVAGRWLGRVAVVAAFLVVWVIQHGYAGLNHDSQLYALLAVARIHPELLGNDIMLRFGSQGSYTLFSPLYAKAIEAVGVDAAAAIVTLVSQLAFFLAAASLARRLMPWRLAWLGLALVCAAPGFYGARGIFALVENFATPRLMTEALVLAGLTAFIARRFWVAGALALTATALHPLMAAAGVAVALFMPPVSRLKTAYVCAAVAAGAALFAILAASGAQLRFDDAWLNLLETGTGYLFLEHWTIGSWARAAVMLCTLFVGTLALEKSEARSLCMAVAVTALVGTAVSYIAGDLMRLVLVVQLQLWRWNWIATLLAMLVLPLITASAWSRGPLWRSAIVLLGAAWLCMTSAYALLIVALVIPVAIAASRERVVVPAPTARLIFLGACALAILAILYHIATVVLLAGASPDKSNAPAMLEAVRAFSRTGALPWLVFLVLITALGWARSSRARALASAGCVLVLCGLVPVSLQEWTSRTYGPDTFRAFASWRARIPVGSEVLWFDSPMSSWFLLQRPSYLSNQQQASGLFSRPAAMAMKARVDALRPFLGSEFAVGSRNSDPSRQESGRSDSTRLAELCKATDVKYVVGRKDLGVPPIATTPPSFRDVQLFACPVDTPAT